MNRYLRVNFKDNDFCTCVNIGCQNVMENIHSAHAVGIESFKITIDEYGLEK